MPHHEMRLAVNLLRVAGNPLAAITLTLIPTAAALYFLSQSFFTLGADAYAALVATSVFLVIGLSLKAATYLLLLAVHFDLAYLAKSNFSVEGGVEKAKAKLVRTLVEKKLDYFSLELFSQGEKAVLEFFRLLLRGRPPEVVVCRRPFLLIKLKQSAKGDKTDFSIVADQGDFAATTLEKYLECVYLKDAKVCELPDVQYLAQMGKLTPRAEIIKGKMADEKKK